MPGLIKSAYAYCADYPSRLREGHSWGIEFSLGIGHLFDWPWTGYGSSRNCEKTLDRRCYFLEVHYERRHECLHEHLAGRRHDHDSCCSYTKGFERGGVFLVMLAVLS